jgi:hypothetical protein
MYSYQRNLADSFKQWDRNYHVRKQQDASETELFALLPQAGLHNITYAKKPLSGGVIVIFVIGIVRILWCRSVRQEQ